MNTRRKFLAVAVTALMFPLAGCQSTDSGMTTATPADKSPMRQLEAGNHRFVSGVPLHPNQSSDHRGNLAAGQSPMAVVVSCSDSRVPPEMVFDQGLGDLFVVRTAGEVVDDQAIGSVEYAVEHLHAHLIVVMGHDACGAVAATIAGGDAPGHIGSIVKAIQPAVDKARKDQGDLLDNAINENVRLVVSQLKKADPILSHEVETGELKIVGARYNLSTGQVQWLDTP
jgi:carbonic anhydrase